MMAGLLMAALMLPVMATTARAGDPYLAAYRYVECMDAAVAERNDCLVHATVEEFCWSAYGWAKLWCTGRYGYDLIKKD